MAQCLVTLLRLPLCTQLSIVTSHCSSIMSTVICNWSYCCSLFNKLLTLFMSDRILPYITSDRANSGMLLTTISSPSCGFTRKALHGFLAALLNSWPWSCFLNFLKMGPMGPLGYSNQELDGKECVHANNQIKISWLNTISQYLGRT